MFFDISFTFIFTTKWLWRCLFRSSSCLDKDKIASEIEGLEEANHVSVGKLPGLHGTQPRESQGWKCCLSKSNSPLSFKKGKERKGKKEKRRKKKTRREGKRKVVFVKDGVCCARIFEGSWDDLENCRPV